MHCIVCGDGHNDMQSLDGDGAVCLSARWCLIRALQKADGPTIASLHRRAIVGALTASEMPSASALGTSSPKAAPKPPKPQPKPPKVQVPRKPSREGLEFLR